MANVLSISKVNEAYIKVNADEGLRRELSEYLTFTPKSSRWDKRTKPNEKGKIYWDGKLKLYDLRTKSCYYGLQYYIEEWAKDQGYTVENHCNNYGNEFSLIEAQEFIESLNLPEELGGLKFEIRDYQIAAFVNAIRKIKSIQLSPTACHKAGDLVLTEIGWKKIEDIKTGDRVFGADGKLKTVTDLFHGRDELYEIKPKNNRSSITVTGNHILPLKHGGCYKDFPENISVNDYLQQSDYYKHCSYLNYNNTPLQNSEERIDCKLSPYFIGIYLGDGHVHSCAVTTNDNIIVDYIKNEINRLNCKITQSSKRITYNIVGAESRRNLIFQEFDKIGLRFGGKSHISCATKFIPEVLFQQSVDFRYELLAGLLDSDGWLCKNKTYFNFTSKSQQLALDVHRLSISLGLVSYIKPKYNKKYDKTYFSVTIMGNINLIPTKLSRKQAPDNKRQRNPYYSSFDVIPVGIQDYYGFEVEDHLYITNDGMITHNSGKSLIIYMIVRWILDNNPDYKGILIVPTVALTSQMISDFSDYGWDSFDQCHQVYEGKPKDHESKRLIVTTWQSIQYMPKSYFKQFDFVIGDEAHECDAPQLKHILSSLINAVYRIGTTGTLSGLKLNRWTLEGLFGPVHVAATTAELMDQGYLAQLQIKCLVLKHPDNVCKLASKKGFTYDIEIEYLISSERRNKYITNLAASLKGNTLILFRFVEKHGIVLEKMIRDKLKDTKRNVYFIAGMTEIEEREIIRKILETETDAILLASSGTFSRGSNVRRLHNIISAHPMKAKVKTLQSIGRSLRLESTKDFATWFDIADDLRWKKKENYTLNHYAERLKIYTAEKFKYKIYPIQLKE